MQQYNRQTEKIDYYCDWCGNLIKSKGVTTFTHHFCSEKCKLEYKDAHNKADENNNSGSKKRGFFGTIFNFIYKLIIYFTIGSIILLIVSEILSK